MNAGLKTVGTSGPDLSGVTKVAGWAQSYWLALGVFYERENLCAVLSELADCGFGVDRFCIIRLSSSERWVEGWPDAPAITGVSGSPPSAGLPEGFSRLFTGVRDVHDFRNGGAYVFSAGALLDAFLEVSPDHADGQLRCPPWMARAQCEQLKAHLRRGAAALIVRPESAAEQDVSSRVLLRHSRHIVWTYDFSQVFAARSADDNE